MRKIKVGLIGLNRLSHALPIFNSIKKQNDVFELVGYALPENERVKFPEIAEKLAGYKESTVEELLDNEEIEAFIIETEELYLTKYALMVAERNKHIHMEKPGGVSLSDFEKLIAIQKKNGKVFHTGYMYRYNPCVKELMQKIKSGELGKIINVEAQMNCCHYTVNRQWLENFPGGIMFFLGCHLVDLILQIQGEPKRVIPLNKSTGVEGTTSTDFGFALFEYENGVSFAKISAAERGGFTRRQLVVSGEKKTVELKPFEMFFEGKQYTIMTENDAGGGEWGKVGTSKKSKPYDRYDDMMKSFAQMVVGEKENPYSYDYELTLYKYMLKACGE